MLSCRVLLASPDWVKQARPLGPLTWWDLCHISRLHQAMAFVPSSLHLETIRALTWQCCVNGHVLPPGSCFPCRSLLLHWERLPRGSTDRGTAGSTSGQPSSSSRSSIAWQHALAGGFVSHQAACEHLATIRGVGASLAALHASCSSR